MALQRSPTSCSITLVGTRRRVDVTLPSQVPVAQLLGDLLDLIDEPRNGALPRWGLVRVGGQPLDLERGLSDQGIEGGTMIFLVDLATAPPPPVIDDYAEEIALTIDVAPGRWSPAVQQALLVGTAFACVSGAGLAMALLPATKPQLLPSAAAAAVLVSLAGVLVNRWLRYPVTGAVLALSSLGLWAAFGIGLAASTGGDTYTKAAMVLGAVAFGALLSRLAGPVALGPAVGLFAASGLSATVIAIGDAIGAGPAQIAAGVAVLTLAALRVVPSLAVRLAKLDAVGDSPAPALPGRLSQSRAVLSGLLTAAAIVSAAAAIVLTMYGGWLGSALTGAIAVAMALQARHFQFVSEVLPLLLGALGGLVALVLHFVWYLSADRTSSLAVAPALVAAGLLLAGLALVERRRYHLTPWLHKHLDELDAVATAATIPLAAWLWGFFDQVGQFAHHLR